MRTPAGPHSPDAPPPSTHATRDGTAASPTHGTTAPAPTAECNPTPDPMTAAPRSQTYARA
eukprot:6810151-Prymnesium_polylepis.1